MDSNALVHCINESISNINASSSAEIAARSPGSGTSTDSSSSSSSLSRWPSNSRAGTRGAESTCGSDASMRGAMISAKLDDAYVCPVCHELLFRPIRPSCQHLFCRFCLILWVEKCAKNQQDSVCPMCRVGIEYPEALPVDSKIEQEIISVVGLESYQLRHKDVVKEKIERVMVDSELEHEDEMDNNFFTTLQFGARAGIVGTAFAGPVGAVAALGIVGVFAAYMQIMRRKREDKRKFGLIEDDAMGWLKIPQEIIQVTNLTLTRATIELYAKDSMFPLELCSFEPHEVGTFTVDGGVKDQQPYSIRITLPGFMEKELAEGSVAPGHGYLFCCTDACVEEALIDEGKYLSIDGMVEIENDSLVAVKCAFYSSSFFPDDTVTIKPGATKLVILPGEIYDATVQVSVASDTFFGAGMELCSIQMREKHAYRILESRIRNIENERKTENLEGDWMFGAFLPDHPS